MKKETSGSRSNKGSNWAADPIRARNAWRFRVAFMLKFYKSMPMLSKRNPRPKRILLRAIPVFLPVPDRVPVPDPPAKKFRQFRNLTPGRFPTPGPFPFSNHPMSIALPKASLILALTWAMSTAVFAGQAPKKEEVFDPNKPVSYYKQIRPILQGACQGCHQPAKAKGKYVMTEFARLLKGAENAPAIDPGKPEASYLVKVITPDAKGKVRDARKRRSAARNPDRSHQEMDQGRRERRHAAQLRAGLRHAASAGLRDAAGGDLARLFARRKAARGRGLS